LPKTDGEKNLQSEIMQPETGLRELSIKMETPTIQRERESFLKVIKAALRLE